MKTCLAILSCFGLFSSLTYASDITGTWKTIDDKTGYVLAHVKIEQQADKTYTDTIIEQFTYPGREMILLCQKCEAPFTDAKIKGLQIISKLRVRGYIGTYLVGRSQTWLRQE